MLSDQTIGRYKIIEKIGSGGMGEVFLAEDEKLGRKVALKTLPAEVATESERMRRFVLEAKTASGLNHPNIITIYEINDDAEVPYIAMEYVKGETLARTLRNKRLEMSTVVDIAIQVAGALAAAHEAGVVHRDVKPDNIIIRPDGLVKVLDFGLVKLTENDGSSDPDAETVAHRTNPGMILGTASFMSPEQSRGRIVDGRSDIFSFGTLLYQMLSGRLPFSGENYVDVIASIIYKEPEPLSAIAPQTPHDLQVLVRKCLRKDRDERYQSARELLADLKDIMPSLGVTASSSQRLAMISDPSVAKVTGDTLLRPDTGGHSHYDTSTITGFIANEVAIHPGRAFGSILLFAAVIGGLFLGLQNFVSPKQATQAFGNIQLEKVTTSGNVIGDQVAVSPDGKYIVYAISENGMESLWYRQVETKANIQITTPERLRHRGMAFSSDGNFVYYTAINENGSNGLYRVPVLGGISQVVANGVRSRVGFRRDASMIAYIDDDGYLVTANPDGSSAARLVRPENGDQWLYAEWFPSGDKLLAVAFERSSGLYYLNEITVGDAKISELDPRRWLMISGFTLSADGRNIFMSARDRESEISQIWRLSYRDRELQRVTNDANDYFSVSVSSDGKTLATVQFLRRANIWKLDPASGNAATQLTADVGLDEGMSGIAFAPNGDIFFSVRERARQSIWRINRDGRERKPVVIGPGKYLFPAVSPDGSQLAYMFNEGKEPQIALRTLDNKETALLTPNSEWATDPRITPDGRWIVYASFDKGERFSLWKVPVAGGEPVRLTERQFECERPSISPDSKQILAVCRQEEGGTRELALVDINGGDPKFLGYPQIAGTRNFSWSADGQSVIYIDRTTATHQLASQPIAGGNPTQISSFESDSIFSLAVDYRTGAIAFSRGHTIANVVRVTFSE
ncbi:MAG: protein kinase [Acidobacteria bacterium]|nr:protein kinase [Acidobacteriota bacterium]